MPVVIFVKNTRNEFRSRKEIIIVIEHGKIDKNDGVQNIGQYVHDR